MSICILVRVKKVFINLELWNKMLFVELFVFLVEKKELRKKWINEVEDKRIVGKWREGRMNVMKNVIKIGKEIV